MSQHSESGTRMPYTITMEPTFVRIVLHGVVTPQDMHALAHDLAAIDASSVVAPHRLADLSAVTAPHLTYPAMQAFAERRRVQPLPNTVRVAIVAPRPIHLGFARMFQNLNQHPQMAIEIFSTVEAAEAWLRAE
jgi:hypothetical protein